jgi:hypothetical protein
LKQSNAKFKTKEGIDPKQFVSSFAIVVMALKHVLPCLNLGCQMVVFKPKIQFWENLGGSCKGRCWYILWTLGPFYGLLLYFIDIWYSLW